MREPTRWVEVSIGIVLTIAGLIPLGTFLAGLVFLAREGFDDDHPAWLTVVVLVVSGALAWWCMKTSYHLLTGHERAGGGLLANGLGHRWDRWGGTRCHDGRGLQLGWAVSSGRIRVGWG